MRVKSNKQTNNTREISNTTMSEQSRLQRLESKLDRALDLLDEVDVKITRAINREQEDAARKFRGHEQVYHKFAGGLVRTSSGITRGQV